MIVELRVPYSGQLVDSHFTVLLIGLLYHAGDTYWLYVDGDGMPGRCRLSEAQVDWRFDVGTNRWIDVDDASAGLAHPKEED